MGNAACGREMKNSTKRGQEALEEGPFGISKNATKFMEQNL
jgi:hypothetical protein